MSVKKRRTKAIIRRQRVAEFACKWDARLDRDRGCHVGTETGYVEACPTHGGAA